MTAGNTEGVYVDTVGDAQHPRLIVYLGGTNPGLGTVQLLGGLNVIFDPATNQPIFENVQSYSGQAKAEQLAIIDAAVRKAPDAEILLMGYSQGGMDAQNSAASGRYQNVTSVITFGSPIVTSASTEYNTIHLWDIRDNVAKLTFFPILSGGYRTYYNDGKDNGLVFQSRADVDDPGLTLFDADDGPEENYGRLRRCSQ